MIDTSVFVAALMSADGGARAVLQLCLQGELRPVMGHKLFLEFVELFERPKLFSLSPTTESDRRELFEGFVAKCRWVEVHFLWRPNLQDEGDNHMLELAVAAGAEAVVTHNLTDFRGELKFPGISILTPSRFLESMR